MEKDKLFKNIVVSVIVYGLILVLIDRLITFHKDPLATVICVTAIFVIPTIFRAVSWVKSIAGALVASILIVFFTGAIYGSLGIATFVIAFLIAPVILKIWVKDILGSLVICIFGTYAIWLIYEVATNWDKYSTGLMVWGLVLYVICLFLMFLDGLNRAPGGHGTVGLKWYFTGSEGPIFSWIWLVEIYAALVTLVLLIRLMWSMIWPPSILSIPILFAIFFIAAKMIRFNSDTY